MTGASKRHDGTGGRGRGRRIGRRAVLLVGVAVSAACAGENLFTGPARAGEVGPRVEINAPLDNFSVAIGDSVQVTVNVSSSAGIDFVVFSGVSSASTSQPGFVRFVEETVDLPSPPDTTLSNFLEATTDATVEDVDIIVEATDLVGATAADTVTIRVGS